MTRKEMYDTMVNIYGEKSEVVYTFADYLQRWESNDWNDRCLELVVQAHIAEPQTAYIVR